MMALFQNHSQVEDTMAVSLSIKNVPEEVLVRLRSRAERNHRSLQQELLGIVEGAAYEQEVMSVDEFIDWAESRGVSTPDEATAWIREMRDGR
jgi:plasmid stability protein